MDPLNTHLDAERMQALLDGTLPPGEAATVRGHVASCARCRAELEAWDVLFRGLDGLAEMSPAPGFADRVMEALPVSEPERLSLLARVRRWLGREPRSSAPDRHLAPGALQDFLEGLLAAPAASSVERHLERCRFCREEAEAWRGVMVGLDTLPTFAPSPGFAERIMAHVRVHNAVALVRPTARERVLGLLRGVSPRTRKRVAALAGAMVTPAVTVALVVYTVFSHPLVTVGTLSSFLWLKVQEAAGGAAAAVLGSGTGGGLLESVATFRAWSVVEFLSGAPAAAAAVLGMTGGLTLVALWVLYRNLIATEPVDGHHANLSY